MTTTPNFTLDRRAFVRYVSAADVEDHRLRRALNRLFSATYASFSDTLFVDGGGDTRYVAISGNTSGTDAAADLRLIGKTNAAAPFDPMARISVYDESDEVIRISGYSDLSVSTGPQLVVSVASSAGSALDQVIQVFQDSVLLSHRLDILDSSLDGYMAIRIRNGALDLWGNTTATIASSITPTGTAGNNVAIVQDSTLDILYAKYSDGTLRPIVAYGSPSIGSGLSVNEIDNGDSPYTALDTDDVILCDCTSGAITVNLMAVANRTGNRLVRIKKIDSSSNAVTIDGSGGETIDGATTQTLASQYDSLTLVPDGTEWWIV